ncbi:hypothetical protein [Streptomyces ipomoeae]|uniref:hypothetical protein n=1 Tax=Streptomyces ipomoeae TaxID=103232 RepID=UPI0035A62CE0
MSGREHGGVDVNGRGVDGPIDGRRPASTGVEGSLTPVDVNAAHSMSASDSGKRSALFWLQSKQASIRAVTDHVRHSEHGAMWSRVASRRLANGRRQ